LKARDDTGPSCPSKMSNSLPVCISPERA
jgi:hypothetical protein